MYLYKIREVGMAIRDYIICRECKCKLLYDGEQNGREWLEERWGKPEEAAWTIEGLLCPPCDMKQQARIAELEAVAEAAFDHCNTSYGTEEFYRTRAELQNALRAGYLGGGE